MSNAGVTAERGAEEQVIAQPAPGLPAGPEPRWLNPEQQRSWRSYIEGTQLLNEVLNRDLEAHTTLSLNEYEVLVRLSEASDRTMRMSELADDLAYSRSRITHTVRRMESRGLVRRAPCPGDRRGVNCTMTDVGWAELVAAAPWHVTSVRHRLVDVLDEEEFLALGDLMARVGARIRG
ncbi:MAG: MarR family winged helix-turn-helix transcriptional regulator [Cellulomonadaceae bacterium]